MGQNLSWQHPNNKVHNVLPYKFIYYIMLYYIILYSIISYHIVSYHIIYHHIISYHIISYHIISYHIISYHIISYHIILYYNTLYCCTFQLQGKIMREQVPNNIAYNVVMYEILFDTCPLKMIPIGLKHVAIPAAII